MKVITIANQKGGVGKTATTEAIGAGLQHKGFRVLFIDVDGQCNLSTDISTDNNMDKNILNVLADNESASNNITTTDNGFSIIKAVPAMATGDLLITGDNPLYRLRDSLEPLKELYDYVVIDTPPTINTATIQALTASDGVVIPALAAKHSIEGIGLLYEAIQTVRQHTNSGLEIICLLATMYNKRTILSRDMKDNMEQLAEQIGTVLFDTPIRNNIAIAEAQALSTDIYSYAPRSNATKDYSKLVDYIINFFEK